MKKIIIITLASLMAVSMFSRCGSGSGSIKSELDSVSYIIGMDLGEMVKGFDSTLNVDIIAKAMKDVINNDIKMTPEAAQEFMSEYQFVRLPAKAKKAENEFFEKVQKDNKNVQKTESGILYEIIEAGDPNQKLANDMDIATVKYEGKLRNGTIFDSTYERSDTLTVDFPIGSVIKGWTEGMKLIGKGGKIKLYIPAELGYGARPPRGTAIGPNEPLIFDIELIDVTPEEERE